MAGRTPASIDVRLFAPASAAQKAERGRAAAAAFARPRRVIRPSGRGPARAWGADLASVTARSKSDDAPTRYFVAPIEEARARLLLAAAMTDQTFMLAAFVWLRIQQSAQETADDGKFEVDRGEMVNLSGAKLATIDAMLTAFREIGLIVDDRCATFMPG
jgi:hypothetical protein